jgi:hypothetical protein
MTTRAKGKPLVNFDDLMNEVNEEELKTIRSQLRSRVLYAKRNLATYQAQVEKIKKEIQEAGSIEELKLIVGRYPA